MNYFVAAADFQTILKFIIVLAIFVAVLLITRYTTKWIGGMQNKQAVGKNISSVEVFRLSNNKYIQIVKIGTEYYALAVSKDNITFLGKVEEDNLELAKETVTEGQSFGSVMEFVKNVKDKTTK